MRTSFRGVSAAALAAALLLVFAAPSPAPVAPRNCGMLTVEGNRYQVKADQVRCRTARTHARRYLARGVRPRGFDCQRYNRPSSHLKFRCWRGRKSILGINR